jgi:SPP1 gp7 family putative phage head morphogenesis protein
LGRAPIKEELRDVREQLTKSEAKAKTADKRIVILQRELTNVQGTLKKMTRSYELREAATGQAPGKQLRTPQWNYRLLFQYAEQSWMVTAAINKIIQAATKGSGPDGKGLPWEWVPKFNFKCEVCEVDYLQRPDRCETPGCSSTVFKEPDRRQLVPVEALFDRPNPRHSFSRIVRGIIRDQEIIDDWFLEVVPDKSGLQPAELWLLNAAGMEIASDDRGQLGNDEWFCPKCYGEQPAEKFEDQFWTREQIRTDPPQCPKCGEELKETAYVLRSEANKIVGRWADEEIIHGNKYGCPTLFGKPKLVGLIGIVGVLLWMESYQYQAYSENVTPDKIVTFPGMDTDAVQEMMLEVIEFKQKNPGAPKNLALGVPNPPAMLETMSNMADLQAKEMQVFYREAIAISYGVSLTSLGVPTPGKLGEEAKTVEVAYETMEEVQTSVEEVINRFLLPKFHKGHGEDGEPVPAITDWEFRLISPKKDDIQQRANIQQTVANAAATLIGLEGLEVEITDDWDIRVSGKATGPRGGAPGPSEAFSAKGYPYSLRKALSTRGIAQDAAIRGIRAAEEEFLAEVRKQYLARIEELSRKGGKLSESDLRRELAGIVDKLDEDLNERVSGLLERAYEAGVNETKEEFPEAAFEQQDEAALKVLRDAPEGIVPKLKTFADQQRDIFEGIIRRAYEVPGEFDLGKMTRDMRRAALDETYKLERIARTETTKISNTARTEQWKKYADPEDHYEWMIAADARTCRICQAIAHGGTAKIFNAVRNFHGNPYTLKELEALIPHFLAHPNCRCTMVRRAVRES